MKRIYLLRHAKSDWGDPDVADFDRPLNDRGLRTAPLVGRLISERQMVPDLIVSSPARRALATAELVRQNLTGDPEIRPNERVYEASPQTLLQVAAGLDDAIGSAMLVGHNPGIEGFVRLLTGRNEGMPTAALAVIDLAVDRWAQIAAGRGTLIEVVRPKDHIAI